MSSCLRRSERPQAESLAHVMTGAPCQGRECGEAKGAPPVATAAWFWHPGRLTQSLATGFHRFLTRFSGRRRSKQNYRIYPPPWSFLVVVLVSSLVSIVDACSSRTIPRLRKPPTSTVRPDITLPEYECQEPYLSQLCLNGATCFMVKVRESEMHNCRCTDGYLGFRCEYKDLDGSYIHSQGRYILETASIAGGATMAVLSVVVLCVADACSSRTTPKPRPPAPTPRPNITFHTYECPPNYAAWFCLNGATCFTVKIGDSLLYNCECADGYMGSRCEYKDLDGSYLPSQRRFMLETASIAGGATIAVFSVVILCVAAYLKWRKRQKHQITQENLNPEGGDVPPPEKVLSVRQECSGTQNLRTVSAGDEPSLRPCPMEVSSPDPLPLDRGDHRLGQGTLIRTGPPWNNV